MGWVGVGTGWSVGSILWSELRTYTDPPNPFSALSLQQQPPLYREDEDMMGGGGPGCGLGGGMGGDGYGGPLDMMRQSSLRSATGGWWGVTLGQTPSEIEWKREIDLTLYPKKIKMTHNRPLPHPRRLAGERRGALPRGSWRGRGGGGGRRAAAHRLVDGHGWGGGRRRPGAVSYLVVCMWCIGCVCIMTFVTTTKNRKNHVPHAEMTAVGAAAAAAAAPRGPRGGCGGSGVAGRGRASR